MARSKKSKDGLTYVQRISALNKPPEEVKRIEKLYEDNINLAHKIAKKYYMTGYWDFDDSVQIARMGLWKACLIWDPGKFKLSTLATNIITRDFVDYEMQQKKQPGILFSLEENCVTEDLNLGDVLIDENSDSSELIVDKDEVSYISESINYILNDIAYDFKLPVSQVKLVYLIFMESTQYSEVNLRNIKFLPRQVVSNIIEEFKKRLDEEMKGE